MVKVRIDRTGQKIGLLTIIKQVEDYVTPQGKHHAQWLCECDCGSEPVIKTDSYLSSRRSIAPHSCGCAGKESAHIANTKNNKIITNLEDENGLYGIGYCSNSNQEFYFDMDDYELIKGYTWNAHMHKTGYVSLEAYDTSRKHVVKMTTILGCKYYDHIDRNPLNNRRYNLRPATQQENSRNQTKMKNASSQYIGVSWNKRDKVWASQIRIDGKNILLGNFHNEEDALVARLQAEVKYFKEFAPQKHLFEQYGIKDGDNNCNTN